MLPTSVHSPPAPNSHFRLLSRYLSSHRNAPEEDDETMSTEQREDSVGSTSKPDVLRPPPEHTTFPADLSDSLQMLHTGQEHNPTLLQPNLSNFPLHRSLPDVYGQPTPFPSQAEGLCPHPSICSSWSSHPNSRHSLPSYHSGRDYSSCSRQSCDSLFQSQPSRHSTSFGSLEQPHSLHSNLPAANFYHHTSSPSAVCCAQCPGETFSRRHIANNYLWAQCHPGPSPYYPDGFIPRKHTPPGHNVPVKGKLSPHSTPLSLEQRKVFVTYEADSDKHVNEIINFVALLRHNGFDTHIDIFEQQFRSISKIDFMERYLSEKEYLIIIIISPKYYETVTASPFGLENDERTFNTVYIHKQLQNEFIQNGSKNFRFIPILFPGAKKSHVPNWLQNTQVYAWPRDRDDILRRLMRVEKYNPPPIGELPTIVSIPI
ncbi:hypothetical protein Q5P01_016399 [Channa striata]|uniref:E3 ubiquitin ligase TRAF3IP2 n=1 Tax=Channa striata TaxID=64152 RepID=A0AA88SFM0_CHASR|nr:hypothetical protein Q5P01_016399 [Channa striata]